MMKYFRELLILLIATLLFVTLIGLQLQQPNTAHAGPLAGFTPTPTGGGDDDDSAVTPPTDPDGGTLPDDFVIIQIDWCDLSCSINGSGRLSQSQPVYKPLAAIAGSSPPPPLLIFEAQAVPTAELLAPVKLIHRGSGWIAEGVLSNHKPTRFLLPYPGQWEVYLMAQAEIIATDEAEIRALATVPTGANDLLGVVEANVLEPQFVKCPLNCVIENPPATPLELPQTGSDYEETSPIIILIVGGVSLLIVGITFILTSRRPSGQ